MPNYLLEGNVLADPKARKRVGSQTRKRDVEPIRSTAQIVATPVAVEPAPAPATPRAPPAVTPPPPAPQRPAPPPASQVATDGLPQRHVEACALALLVIDGNIGPTDTQIASVHSWLEPHLAEVTGKRLPRSNRTSAPILLAAAVRMASGDKGHVMATLRRFSSLSGTTLPPVALALANRLDSRRGDMLDHAARAWVMLDPERADAVRVRYDTALSELRAGLERIRDAGFPSRSATSSWARSGPKAPHPRGAR